AYPTGLTHANRSPSLTVVDDPHAIFVVWEMYLDGETDRERKVVFSAIDLASGIATMPQEIAHLIFSPPRTFSTVPVIASGVSKEPSHDRYFVFVWYDGTTNTIKGGVARADMTQWYATTNLRTNVTIQPQISIAPISKAPLGLEDGGDETGTGTPWQLAWVENNILMYGDMEVSGALTLNHIFTLAAPTDGAVYEPSATNFGQLSTNLAGIAWGESIGDFAWYVIKYREQQSGTTWNAVTNVWSDLQYGNYRRPSVASSDGSDIVSLTWESVHGQSIRSVQRQATGWSSEVTLAQGINPSASVGYSAGTPGIVLSRGTTTPYAIQASPIVSAPTQPLSIGG
ncbi:MAG: hypothetical protein AAB393_04135, partial [Bacteroidota bacterium]